MRVVSGIARGTKLLSVPGDSTRPILDRVKTALFDILRPEIADCNVLDLFAGSGSVGIEALSQGAGHCTFLDLERQAVATIKRNLEATRLTGKSQVLMTDSFSFLKRTTQEFDLIYIAPPQYKGLWVEAMNIIAQRTELLSQNGQIIVQIDPTEYQELKFEKFVETQQRKYGSTLLVFFSWQGKIQE